MMFYLTPNDDKRQDQEIGDFRSYAKSIVSKQSRILEIGPSYGPVYPRREGFNVSILDHLDTEILRAKYSAMNVDISLIEDVDFVWKGGAIHAAVDGQKFDFVLASHVVEHATNFVQFLNDICETLAKNGKIILMVPDKRYCFDLFQPLTDTAKILSDHVRGASIHTMEAMYRIHSHVSVDYKEHFFHHKKDLYAWGQGSIEDLKFINNNPIGWYTDTLAKIKETDYIDFHEYFFTPSSFLMIIEELNFLGLLQMKVATLTRARGCEFLVVLEPGLSNSNDLDRYSKMHRELSLNILREHQEAFSEIKPLHTAPDLSFLA
ncbi:MAG: methyltransferase domain-containing protein [Nitrosomonas sp.]|nr:methyltransferase domain-containing protein [Nitrosomonas sp.]